MPAGLATIGALIISNPTRRLCDPGFNLRRRILGGEFGLDRARKNYSREETRKNFNPIDKDEVIDGTGVGDDQAHRLQPGFLEGHPLRFKIFQRVFLIDTMRL